MNADTIKNPYSNRRKALCQELEHYNASITYHNQAFASAERTTQVAVVVIDVEIPKRETESIFFENMKKKYIKDSKEEEVTDLIDNDFIRSAVTMYNVEVEAGLSIIREYRALAPYIAESFDQNEYNGSSPILNMTIGDKKTLSEAAYVKAVRKKYWSALFGNPQFVAAMPHDLLNDYRGKINELKQYDFTYGNIKELQISICKHLVSGIEETILKLFETFTFSHAWSRDSEYDQNIHYYNGWATNKAWYVNNKVILPWDAFSGIWKTFQYGYTIKENVRDIEKAFDYLAGCPGATSFSASILQQAEKEHQTKNIRTKYMDLTFYKKGTVHIKFLNLDLVKKLNIFAGSRLNMLPPRYGKVSYDDLTPEEKVVVDDFNGGRQEYDVVYQNQDKYLMEIPDDIMRIGMSA